MSSCLFQVAIALRSIEFYHISIGNSVDPYQIERTNGSYLYRNYFYIQVAIVPLSCVFQVFSVGILQVLWEFFNYSDIPIRKAVCFAQLHTNP